MDGAVYSMMVLFMLFGFLNVVIGIFVNETNEIEVLDRELVLQNALRKSEAMRNNIKTVFDEIDYDGNGVLTCDELKRALNDEHIRAQLNHFEIDVPPGKAETFCEIIDKDQNGTIETDEFIS